jgi:hypothetical protein
MAMNQSNPLRTDKHTIEVGEVCMGRIIWRLLKDGDFKLKTFESQQEARLYLLKHRLGAHTKIVNPDGTKTKFKRGRIVVK